MEALRRAWARVSAWLVPTTLIAAGVLDLSTSGALSSQSTNASFPGPAWLQAVCLTVICLPLFWRHRSPVAVLVSVLVLTGAYTFVFYGFAQQPPIEPFLVILVAIFAMATSTEGRGLVVGTAFAAIVLVPTALISNIAGQAAGDVYPAVLFGALTWLVGRLVYRQRAVAFDERARANRIEMEQDDRRRAAVADERARIARDLHDVVAHSLSVIVVQAAAERWSLADGEGETAEVLESIEATGRQAMIELRRMLGVLRTTDGDAPLSPQPGLANLDDLVEQVERSGLSVALRREGSAAQLPPGIELSAFRVIQEALTNVVRHAHATHVDVCVRTTSRAVEIDVIDDGDASGSDGPSGFGLVGMRERASVYGGRVVAGPVPDGPGYRVSLVLPLESGELAHP